MIEKKSQNIRAFLRMEGYLEKLKQDLRHNYGKLKQETINQVASSVMQHDRLIRIQKQRIIELEAKKVLYENKRKATIEEAQLKQKVKSMKAERQASRMVGRKNIRLKTQVSYTAQKIQSNMKFVEISIEKKTQQQSLQDPQKVVQIYPNLKNFEQALIDYSNSLILHEERQNKQKRNKQQKKNPSALKRVKTQYEKELNHYNKEVELYIGRHEQKKQRICLGLDWVAGNMNQIKSIKEKVMEPRVKITLLDQLKMGYEEKYKSGKKQALQLISEANIAKAQIILKEL